VVWSHHQISLDRCHQVFQNSSHVGRCRGRKVRRKQFFIETDEGVLRWVQYEMRYSGSGFWIPSLYLTRPNLFANFSQFWPVILNFWIFRNWENFDLAKSWRTGKFESPVQKRRRRRSKNWTVKRFTHVWLAQGCGDPVSIYPG
jgi:hypothetical protein